MIINKKDNDKWLQIKVIVTNAYKFSSNVIEVIRPILISFFLQKDFTHTKSTNWLIAQKKKKICTKNI